MKEKFRGEWLVTGDMGFADDQGYFYFQGRGDDVIKTSGLSRRSGGRSRRRSSR